MYVASPKSMSSADKEYKFLTEPDNDLKCMICLEVARDPLQHEECGKLFCKTCLEKYGRHNPCPNCRKQKSHYYVDKRGKRSIDGLEVTCSNAKRKCDWQGALGTLDAHMTTCEFSLIPCPNNCKDGENEAIYFTRKEMQDHLKNDCPNRDFKCPNCGEEGIYSTITQEHDKVCEKKIVLCHNKDCTMEMPREEVNTHMANECIYTLIPCKYHIIGCKTRLRKSGLVEHENDDKLHLRIVMDAALDLEQEGVTLKEGEPFTFAVTNYQQALESGKAFESLPFYTNPQGYHLKLYIYASGRGAGKNTHISAYTRIKEGKHDTKLEWPFDGTITITLLNQHHDGHHHSMELRYPHGTAQVGCSRGFPTFISHDEISNATSTKQYLKNDTLYFRVSVDDYNYKPWLNCTAVQHKLQ